jgi:hypothetical protein
LFKSIFEAKKDNSKKNIEGDDGFDDDVTLGDDVTQVFDDENDDDDKEYVADSKLVIYDSSDETTHDY